MSEADSVKLPKGIRPVKILRRYKYDPLDRLAGMQAQEQAFTQRFYQENDLVTELGEQDQQTIFRHGEQPLGQRQILAGATDTVLLATDQAHSVLQNLSPSSREHMAYSAYGHRPADSGLSSLLGFNGECLDGITGHYLLGQGKRAFNPVLMRFNSPDELSPFGDGGINPYGYCKGDPINFYDPSGNTGIFRLWNIPIRPSAINKYSLHKTRPTASSINRSHPSRNPMLNGMLNRPTGNLPPSASSTSSSTSRLAAQPGPSTSTQAPQEISFPHPLAKTKTYTPNNNTNRSKYTELLDDASKYDSYTTDYPNFKPTASRELLDRWNRHNTLASRSERTTPKLDIAKAKNQLRKVELQIKQYNIRKIDGNRPTQ
jgi:RHS repeat-associated protein